jgi:integrase
LIKSEARPWRKFMGGETTPSRAVVQSAGNGYRLRASIAKREFALGSNLQHLALRFTQVSTNVRHSALKRAGIEGFRWHGLRHTWASWHVRQGTPPYLLQELRG